LGYRSFRILVAYSGTEGLRRNYRPEVLRPLLAETGVNVTVPVQASSLAEVHWLLDLASANDFIAGVVGWVDLTSHDLRRYWDVTPARLQVQRSPARHPIEAEPDDAWMLRQEAVAGLTEWERSGIPFDLVIYPQHLKYLSRLREKCPRFTT
jgi:L-fuconolactonase